MPKGMTWDYLGYLKVLSTNLNPKVYQNPAENPYNLLENEYLIVLNEGKRADLLKWQDGHMKKVIVKPVNNDFHGKIKPKNIEQECVMDLLADKTTTVKVITGSFGSGKSYLGLTYAVEGLKNGDIDCIWNALSMTEERQKEIAFSRCYAVANNVIIVAK